ncbi:MAG: 4'-phosphopantetheinyl transferase superfamily protein [Acidimicrobiia bacterium]|nr:4'-phosphopantetheinyl transferase superfamily protein [Acidimicrobiia bacterium]NNF11483.1 4'-phosphopantetheinyl transferase superfamily protein [Acidimicrobiia bacterium]NNL69551.1 4'-phosphopantetheinyl transferase superfamily protein [Acidimicrobiia bacterium]
MTEREVEPTTQPNGWEIGPLPHFASLVVKRSGDPYDNRFEDDEMALLPSRAVIARQDAFRLGRAAAHEALAAIGRDDKPVTIGDEREPVWPAGVVGSISHAADVAVALVAPAGETPGIGIDVESRRYAPELNQHVPRPEERAWLEEADAEERHDRLLALFSAKEAIFKAFYPRVGRFFGFEAASVQPTEGGFVARLAEDLDPAFPPDRSFSVFCGWSGPYVLSWVILPTTGGVGPDH